MESRTELRYNNNIDEDKKKVIKCIMDCPDLSTTQKMAGVKKFLDDGGNDRKISAAAWVTYIRTAKDFINYLADYFDIEFPDI